MQKHNKLDAMLGCPHDKLDTLVRSNLNMVVTADNATKHDTLCKTCNCYIGNMLDGNITNSTL